MIELHHVSKTFDHGKSYAVKDISIRVATGETLVLLGSSGCGKTTTLKMINRLIEPSRGTIAIDGRNIKDEDPVRLRRSIGYAFQGIGLFPHMTVAENVAIVLKLTGSSRKECLTKAGEMMEMVSLDPGDFATRYPAELSGGQKQRVGVARALASSPENLLMDEPFGALDAITRDTLQKEFIKLKKVLGITVIFVTHDIIEALTLADRIAVMHNGSIEQTGTKHDILRQPATEFVRTLLARPAEKIRDALEEPA
jgi:osmoprotectant transport system ATP-binding protein